MRLNPYRVFATWTHRKSPLQVLECKQGATRAELKQKFYALSQEYHPDKNIGKSDAERASKAEKFLLIQEAYNLLKEHPNYQFYPPSTSQDIFRRKTGREGGFRKGANRYRPFDDSFYEATSSRHKFYTNNSEQLLENWQVWFFGTSFIISIYYFTTNSHLRSKASILELAQHRHDERLRKSGLDRLIESETSSK